MGTVYFVTENENESKHAITTFNEMKSLLYYQYDITSTISIDYNSHQ